jgi:NDP-sugar pyrophosphorylase family protein
MFMKILIPMAGLGSRFPSHLYPMPKPLISVNGEPMISKAIKSINLEGQHLFVIAKNEFTNSVKETIRSICSDAEFIEIDYVTEGPAVSALLFKELINTEEELVIANCDQIMEWDSSKFLLNARLNDGCIVTYHTETKKNSYATVDKNALVTEVREKQVISNISLNGIHYWKRGKDFVESAESMIAAQDRAPNGEFYIGPTYNYMISNNLDVGIYHIPNQMHHPVGVPEDLDRYLEYEKNKIK